MFILFDYFFFIYYVDSFFSCNYNSPAHFKTRKLQNKLVKL